MKGPRLAVATAFLHLVGGTASAQVLHEPVGCLVADRFPRLEASFQPMDSLARARLVFRPEGGRFWYSVPMKPEADVLAGVLPKPKGSLKAVEYYVEVTDHAAVVARTADHVARVASGPAACQDTKVATSLGSATVALEVPAGAPAVPGGFSSSGLGAAAAGAGAAAGTAVAATTAAAAGGGIATGVLVGAGVAVAAGAGVAVAAGGGGENAPDPSEGVDTRPIRIIVSVTSPQFQLPYPFTVHLGGQSASSQGGETIELEAAVVPGAHEMSVVPARGGHVSFGFRVGRESGPGGVELGSVQPSAPVILQTPPCGTTVNTPGPFTIRFRVISTFAGSCSAGQGG